ncbi:THUMP domain-containing protein 1-like [Pocillopora verrucosa]|uniref:THUMP domain-containing protein 1-like n=1 Tax=Pocillopora verrucosa TaxID=203993 RepID=UPI0033424226
MADGNTSLKRKHSKAFYVGNKKKKRGQELLAPGMKGVLVTCNERENLCVREAYNVLNEYADKLYGPEHSLQDNDSVNESDSEDIEDALAKEVKQLQETKTEKRFQAVLTGAVNVIFIKTNLPDSKDPTDLVHTVLNDMLEKGCKKTRHCQRFLPISGSCHANKEEMKKLAEQLFQSSFFAEDVKPSTFSVMYKSRNNSSIHRDDTISALASIVMNAGKGHTVNLNNPDLAICVEIMKNVCCMSVVKDFMKLRKYNIHEVNEKIFQSQRTDNEDSEKVKSKNQPIMKSDNNDADSGVQRDGNNAGSDMNRDGNNADSTTVDEATSENPDT